VTKPQPTAFERVFPTREFLQGGTRSAVLWASFGSLLLCLLLCMLYLVADLLLSGGSLVAAAADESAIQTLTGELPVQPEVAAGAEIRYVARGILPSVWWGRDKPWGPALARLYRALPLLHENLGAFVLLLLTCAALWLARFACHARARALRLRTSLEIASRLRLALHRQALRLGPGDFETKDHEQVLELFTTEADRIRQAVFRWSECLGRNPLRILLLTGLAALVHWELLVLCAVPLWVAWYLSQRQYKRLQGLSEVAAARSQSELKLLAESLRKTRLVRGYGMEDFARQQFEKHLQRFQDDAATSIRAPGWSRSLSHVMVVCCLLFVYYQIGIKVLVAPRELSFAAALLFMGSLALIYVPLRDLWQIRFEHEAASEAAARIYRYLNQIPDVSQAVGAKFLQPMSKSLEFDSVSYVTPEKKRLCDGLSVRLAAGRQIALVSTDPQEALAVAYLLPRFIEPQAGRVLIDGEDIAWVTLESLRAEVLCVGGNDPFFTGTVRENISGGSDNYTLTEVTEAAKITHAHHFISKLPQGYETVVGERGEHLDVGQSFRLGLARAVLRNPALLIIEEPARGLSDDTKSLLDDAYNRIVQDRTVLFIPTRMATLRRVDEIVLIHQGKVEAVGPHAQLVKTSQLYRHWEYMRFNEFRHHADVQPVGT
jgi:ABC-type multidrug transport system fused ATPase/permease subunit